MTEVRFYHLTNNSIEDVLPLMLERAVSRDKKRVMVLAGSVDRVEYLSNYLWIYSKYPIISNIIIHSIKNY